MNKLFFALIATSAVALASGAYANDRANTYNNTRGTAVRTNTDMAYARDDAYARDNRGNVYGYNGEAMYDTSFVIVNGNRIEGGARIGTNNTARVNTGINYFGPTGTRY